MAGNTIHAAGGVVLRGRGRPRVAVVQRSKDELWVLPRGKLRRDESPIVGARREVMEETGFRVRVREFLGAITYRAQGRPKVVQFWRMRAAAQPSREVTDDIMAVKWLPLAAAVKRLSYPLEKLFLDHVGRSAIRRRIRRSRKKARTSAAKAEPSRISAPRNRRTKARV
jgi:8-oxo-dGTP pyrophosphatase MutT (NUDIX family)